MLTIPPTRRAFEAARAAEIQAGEEAVRRERIVWYFVGLACVLGGTGLAAVGLHMYSDVLRTIWFSAAILLGDIGPLAIFIYVLDREER